jgi:hypothetical protein
MLGEVKYEFPLATLNRLVGPLNARRLALARVDEHIDVLQSFCNQNLRMRVMALNTDHGCYTGSGFPKVEPGKWTRNQCCTVSISTPSEK